MKTVWSGWGKIKKLKISKAKAKTCFTKQNNLFLQFLGYNSSPDDLIELQKKLDDLAENVMDILSELIKLMEMKDKAQVDGLIDEMTIFEGEYSKNSKFTGLSSASHY